MKSRSRSAAGHLDHGAGEHADLVPAARHDRHVELAVTDPPRQLGQLAQWPGDPAGQRAAPDDGQGQRQDAQHDGQPPLGIHVLGVVALGHDHFHQPAQVAGLQRHRAAQVGLVVVIELERGLRLLRAALHGRQRQLAIDDLRARGARAPPADQHRPLARRHEHAPVGGDLQILERAGQAVEREIHREHAQGLAGGIEERRGARDAQPAAGEELVRLGPDDRAAGRGGAEVRPLGRAIAVVVRAAGGLAPAVGEDAVFLEPDPVSDGEAAVHEDVAPLVAPGADEAVAAVAVADPAHVGMRAQHGLGERLECAHVVGVEATAADQLGAEASDRLGVLQHPLGVGRGEPRGLGHRGVEQGAGARTLIAPGQAADDRPGETGEQHDEPDQGQRERRPTALESAEAHQRANATTRRDQRVFSDPCASPPGTSIRCAPASRRSRGGSVGPGPTSC